MKENKILIDWFSFTTSMCSPANIIELLGMQGCPFQESYGFYGWTKSLFFSNIRIMFGGDVHEGLVMLEMSGQGCRTFETLGHGDFNNLFRFCLDNKDEVKITRIDVAFDDFTGLLDLDNIVEDTLKCNFISRFRAKAKVEITINPDGSLARSVTHGKRSSSVMVRIYDKAAERNRSDEVPHWVRCELQLRQERAQEFVRLLIEENEMIDNLYFAVLNHYLRYVTISDTDSNKWRADIAEHWLDFFNYVDTIKHSLYVQPGMDYNAAKLKQTYGEHFAGGIYTYIQLWGINALVEDVEKSKHKLNPKYRMLLAEEEQLTGVDLIDCQTSI
ncbi:MAG: replication initiation factor domain-containing protein [Ruminococcus sp.]|nr:replication initiation factor domain-containing protein [Ruminococcus sp.]